MANLFGTNIANLLGTSDPDLIRGFGGDDVLGGGGADFLDRGSGIDRATYVASFEGVTVSLGNPGFVGSGSGGTAQGDLLIDIENVTASTFGDVIEGNGQANILNGLGGNGIR